MRLRNVVFWTFAFLLGAAAAHAALLLWLPRHEMGRMMDTIAARHGENRMWNVTAAEWATVAADADPAMHHAACLIRPGHGETIIDARIPAGYWSITVYAPNGTEIYALDDRGASMRRLRLRFVRADVDLPGSGRLQTPRLDDGVLHVPLAVDRALAVIAAHAPYPGLMPRLREALAATTCTHVSPAKTTAQNPARPAAQGLPMPRPRPVGLKRR